MQPVSSFIYVHGDNFNHIINLCFQARDIVQSDKTWG